MAQNRKQSAPRWCYHCGKVSAEMAQKWWRASSCTATGDRLKLVQLVPSVSAATSAASPQDR